jgi:hypothetical protein
MSQYASVQDIIDELRERTSSYGDKRRLATDIGISEIYLRQLVTNTGHGYQTINKKLLKYLDYETAIFYRKRKR